MSQWVVAHCGDAPDDFVVPDNVELPWLGAQGDMEWEWRVVSLKDIFPRGLLALCVQDKDVGPKEDLRGWRGGDANTESGAGCDQRGDKPEHGDGKLAGRGGGERGGESPAAGGSARIPSAPVAFAVVEGCPGSGRGGEHQGREEVIPVDAERLLALLTGVLFACLICSRLFLQFCLGKMAECTQFQDYLQAGVHDSVREGTPAASWAKAKMRLTKFLRHLGDSRSQWLQTFASASRFGWTEDALIENLIGYTLTEQVQINMTTGAFEKIRVQSETVNKASDPALLSLLERQAAPIKSLMEKVNSLSEAPTRSEKYVPPLCLKGVT